MSSSRRIIRKDPRFVVSDIAGANYIETVTPVIPYGAKKKKPVKDIRSVKPEWAKSEEKWYTTVDSWTSHSASGVSRS